MSMKLKLIGHFCDVSQHTDGTFKVENPQWKERTGYYEGMFAFEAEENFLNVRIVNDMYNILPEDFLEGKVELEIEGFFNVEILRGNGIAKHYVSITAVRKIA